MRRLAVALLAVIHLEALACGVCIDDKIASCYDHGVISRAHAQGHAVAFFAIQGDIVRSAETRRGILRRIDALRGVQRGTARVSLENAALSFAFDPKLASPAELERRLAAGGLKVSPLRILEDQR